MQAPTITQAHSTNTEIRYELLTSHIDDCEQMSYTTYGICVRDEHDNVLLKHVDISTSREQVERFIEMVKEGDVAVVHINDVLEDFME